MKCEEVLPVPDTNQSIRSPSDQDAASPIKAWRDAYKRDETMQPGQFELGLCMAGAVSAGAYTAGVLDVLVEALDAFAAEKKRRRAAGEKPLHDVTLSVLGGASAGGMCAAIAAIFLDTQFPPVRPEADDRARRRDNPFWRAWVEDIDIRPLLHTRDIARCGKLTSLLDCTVLDEIVDGLLDARTEPARRLPEPRPWLADPLRVVLTLANLRGVPYALCFDNAAAPGATIDAAAGSTGGSQPASSAPSVRHWMSQHADHVRFVVPLAKPADPDGDTGWAKGDKAKIGETVLSRSTADREAFKAVALGTGSFPVALSPRLLERNPEEYAFRAALLPSSPIWGDALHPPPKWAELVQPAWRNKGEKPYKAWCVDGGAMNNEPLDLVRRVLSGQQAPNPRPATEAQRALLLIDPFVKPEEKEATTDPSLLGTILPLFNALIQNSRFKPEDLAMAADPQIGSRFVIAPSRGDAWDGSHSPIAAGPLGGFMGFFARSYREHDYFLGRRNALRFLRWVFVLPDSNRVFKRRRADVPPDLKPEDLKPEHLEDLWDDEARTLWGVHRRGTGEVRLPIIPLCGDLLKRAGEEDGADGEHGEPLPRWPSGEFRSEEIRTLVEHRIEAVVPLLRDALMCKLRTRNEGWTGWGKRKFLHSLLRSFTSNVTGRLTDFAMEKIQRGADEVDGRQQQGAAR